MEAQPSNQLVQHQYNGLTNLWEERLSILRNRLIYLLQQNKQVVYSGQVTGSIEQKRNMNMVMVLILKTLVQRINDNLQAPIVIKSARIYVGTSGSITFGVVNAADGAPVSSVTPCTSNQNHCHNWTRGNSVD